MNISWNTHCDVHLSNWSQNHKQTNNSHHSFSLVLNRKLAKSTLVLIPLFGVHYIIFAGLPSDVDQYLEIISLYFELFFNSFQVSTNIHRVAFMT